MHKDNFRFCFHVQVLCGITWYISAYLSGLFYWHWDKISRGQIHNAEKYGWPLNSSHKGPVTWIMFPFDGVIINQNQNQKQKQKSFIQRMYREYIDNMITHVHAKQWRGFIYRIMTRVIEIVYIYIYIYILHAMYSKRLFFLLKSDENTS